MSGQDFKIVCPCCQAKILVDHKTGAVLSHERRVVDHSKRSFEEMLGEDKKRKNEAEDLFAQAVREHENREELLEKKFKEAFEKADKSDSAPPPHPFEYD
jgi:hypothetical protein